MPLRACLYLSFRRVYSEQTTINVEDQQNNAGDMYRSETINTLTFAVNCLSDVSEEDFGYPGPNSIRVQKNWLKISILNLSNITSHFLIPYLLINNSDERSNRVVHLITLLTVYQNDVFGKAYYHLNNSFNVELEKHINLSIMKTYSSLYNNVFLS